MIPWKWCILYLLLFWLSHAWFSHISSILAKVLILIWFKRFWKLFCAWKRSNLDWFQKHSIFWKKSVVLVCVEQWFLTTRTSWNASLLEIGFESMLATRKKWTNLLNIVWKVSQDEKDRAKSLKNQGHVNSFYRLSWYGAL